MVIILSIIYFSILFFFGWQVARRILNENRIEHLIAFALVFGLGLYVFFVNVVGYFMPIVSAFYLVLSVFFLLAFAMFSIRYFSLLGPQKPLKFALDNKWRIIVFFFTFFLIISMFYISFRHPMDTAIMRVPTAVTIMEGNFPPVQIFNPTELLRYHYAPELLAASTAKVTGMPIYTAFDFQRAFFGGGMFLLVFLMILSFFPKSFFVAFSGSLMMLYAGSLSFLNIFPGIQNLFNKYILGQDINAPFKFISDVIVNDYTTPTINSLLTQHWGAMAFSLMVAVFYIYFHLLNWENKKNIHYLLALAIGAFLLAFQALISEPYYAIMSAVILATPFVYFLIARNFSRGKEILITSLLILAISFPIAILQGGLLRIAFVHQFDITVESENISDRAVMFTSGDENLKLFKFDSPFSLFDGTPTLNSNFLMTFGLILLVLIPSLILLFRKKQYEMTIVFLGLALASLLVPILINSDFRIQSIVLGRFFLPFNTFSGILIGVALALLYLRTKGRIFKNSLIFFAAILMLQGLFTHAVWFSLGYPPGGEMNPNTKFFTAQNSVEKKRL